MELVLRGIDDVKTGSLAAAFAILFFPVTFLGMYSPFGIRLLLRSAQSSGTVSGTVYGISTVGSIVGTLGTTFYLIPTIGTRAITLTLGAAGIARPASSLIALPSCGAARRSRSRWPACAAWPAARRAPMTWSTRRSAPTCSSAPTAASRISRPNTTTSSSPSGATS